MNGLAFLRRNDYPTRHAKNDEAAQNHLVCLFRNWNVLKLRVRALSLH